MISLSVVCESRADFDLISCLVDRSLTENIDWIDGTVVNDYRQWFADGSDQDLFYKWGSIKRLCREHRIKVHGHFNGAAGNPDAAAGRRALHLVRRLAGSMINVILLIRDQDDQPERLDGLQQSVTEFQSSFDLPVIIGLAVIEREAWLLSGFIPSGQQELDLLEMVRKEVGFDPTSKPHRLDAAKDDLALKSPKRVLGILTANEYVRELQCTEVTPIDILKRNGTDNGLSFLLNDIETKIVPMFK